MTGQLDTANQHGLTDLVTGVVDDAQEVIKQQLNLFKAELTNKARDTAFAAVPLMAGICCLFIAIICLAFAVAYGLASEGASDGCRHAQPVPARFERRDRAGGTPRGLARR